MSYADHLQTLRDRQAASFARAQAQYDSAEPPEPDDREPPPDLEPWEWEEARAATWLDDEHDPGGVTP